MQPVTIRQSRCNYWIFLSVIFAIVLFIISVAGMIYSFPISLSFEWFILPVLFTGSLVLGCQYLYWLLNPRDSTFTISHDYIHIEDQTVFKWTHRRFSPDEITKLTYNSESLSHLKTKDGTTHYISDILMIQRESIFSVLSEIHPHIKLKKID